MRGHGAGKGSGARLGQYSPRSIAAYSRGHERLYGRGCSPCRGRGYNWNENKHGEMVKVTCTVCKGKGRIENEVSKTTISVNQGKEGSDRTGTHSSSACGFL